MTHSHGGYAPADLIEEHLDWLWPRVRTGQDRYDSKGERLDLPTVTKRRRCLLHAEEHLPFGIHRASTEEIEKYLSHWAGWTRYTYDTHLRSYYEWAVRLAGLDWSPMQDLPKPSHPDAAPRPCEDHELALAATARAPYGVAIRLAAYLGLRCGEIARARRRDVARDRLRVLGKGGRSRLVPISEEVAELVYGASDYLVGRHVSEYSLTRRQRAIWRSLGLPESFTLHSGRHWYATQLVWTGADLRQVQALLGHASVTTTTAYLKVSDRQTAAAVARLPKLRQIGPDCGRPDLTTAA